MTGKNQGNDTVKHEESFMRGKVPVQGELCAFCAREDGSAGTLPKLLGPRNERRKVIPERVTYALPGIEFIRRT
jgi:hypothetical protein